MRERELYTLDEARPIILREHCVKEGHEIVRTALRHNLAGFVAIEIYACERCDVVVTLTCPSETKKYRT